MKFLFKLLLLLFFISSCQKLSKSNEGRSFAPTSIHYLILDAGTIPNLPDHATSSSEWVEAAKNKMSFGFNEKVVWLAIKATNETSENSLILELGNPLLDTVFLYEAGQKEPFLRVGDFIPLSEWQIISKSVTAIVPWEAGKTKTIFARIETTSAIFLAINFYNRVGFEVKENKENSILGFFYGTIIIMVLYNLFIFLLLKDPAYILYSLSIFFNLLVQFYLNGMSNQIFTPDDPQVHNRIGSVFVCLSALSGWNFAKYYLNLKFYLPRFNTFITILIFIVLVYFLLVLNVLSLRIIARYTIILAQIFVGTVFLSGLLSVKAGNRQAKLFLLGWSLLLMGILLFTLMQSGVVSSNWFTIYSNQIGSTLEAGVLSLALADKINQLKEEKASAQLEALAMLEDKVKARTKELDESLQIIRKDLNVAKKIQRNLFTPPRILDERIQFEVYFSAMSEVGGDFFDIARISKDKYRFCVADATGHGIQAALITMAIKSEYESLKSVHDHPDELLAHLNRIFFHKYSMLQTIFTCVVCDIDLVNKQFSFAAAGHPDQLWIDRGKFQNLPRTGRIIGITPDSSYSRITKDFSLGDRVFLFSDGLFEQFNSSRLIYGEERLYDTILSKNKLSLEDTVQTTVESLTAFLEAGSIQDDITFLACEFRKTS